MSVHGVCFDEGLSGNCGLECRGFIDNDCSIPDEIAEHYIDEYREELLVYRLGELRLAVARSQNVVEFDEEEELRKMVSDGTAVEYFKGMF